jgi:hypothetical protein
MMATRFKGDISRSTARIHGRLEGEHFGVGLTGPLVPPLTDDMAVTHQNAADPRVGAGRV